MGVLERRKIFKVQQQRKVTHIFSETTGTKLIIILMLTESKELSQSKLLLQLKQFKLIPTASHVLETLRGAPCRTFFKGPPQAAQTLFVIYKRDSHLTECIKMVRKSL